MLGKLKDKLDRGIATVSVKSESMVETSRIKSHIQNYQRQQTTLITQLGNEMYAMWKAGEMNRERFEQVCKEIYGFEQAIAEQNRRIEQIRVEEQQLLGTQPMPAQPQTPQQMPMQPQMMQQPIPQQMPAQQVPEAPVPMQPQTDTPARFCPACGKPVPADALFCVECGVKLEN